MITMNGDIRFFFQKFHTFAGTTTHSFTICEHGSRTVNCGSGYFIYVTYAMYGRQLWSTCGLNLNTNCRAGSSLQRSRDYCHGKQRCQITASNVIFGDPCHSVPKYLTMNYNCASKHSMSQRSNEKLGHTIFPQK